MRQIAGAIASLVFLAGCSEVPSSSEPEPPERLSIGMLTSLPIFWTEDDALAALSREGNRPEPDHWAVAALQSDHELVALDTVSEGALADLDVLILAQPRPLAPEENLWIDRWVEAGGAALVFADPQLVGDYPFDIGDPRRPIDSALLSPILARWGLELQVDDAAPFEARTVRVAGEDLAIAAEGRFTLREPAGGGTAKCALKAESVIAQCRIGKGGAVLLADATLLEDPVGGPGSPLVLAGLLGMAREPIGEIAGMPRE